eukprot:8057818-Pyramimonas_sp.AAC.4
MSAIRYTQVAESAQPRIGPLNGAPDLHDSTLNPLRIPATLPQEPCSMRAQLCFYCARQRAAPPLAVFDTLVEEQVPMLSVVHAVLQYRGQGTIVSRPPAVIGTSKKPSAHP